MPPTFALLIPLLIALAGCDLYGGGDSLRVKAIPTSAVEMALDIRTSKGGSVRITRDGQDVASFNLFGRDTIFIDSGLSPTTTYKWQIRLGGELVGVRAATLDTTSSQFTWQTFTFGGDAGSSVLHDVAIINDNNIWAVGEIFVRDESHINGYQMYNAVHWNGVEWKLKKVPYFYLGQAYYNPIKSIFAFDENNIWFVGNGVIHWDGHEYNPKDLPQNVWGANQINKIWGSSSANLYIVGDSGSLAYYDGTVWQKIESGTKLNFQDIWGSQNPETGKWQLLAVASNLSSVPSGQKLIDISETSVRELPSSTLSFFLRSIWFQTDNRYFAAGGGVHISTEVKNDRNWRVFSQGEVTNHVSRHVRGLGLNDVMVVGDFGEIVHFNGASWTNFHQVLGFRQGYYLSVAIAKNIVVAVGEFDHAATVSMARR